MAKPTQKQLEALWENVSRLFEMNGLESYEEMVEFSEDSADIAYDVLCAAAKIVIGS